jgi:hypothetical protein
MRRSSRYSDEGPIALHMPGPNPSCKIRTVQVCRMRGCCCGHANAFTKKSSRDLTEKLIVALLVPARILKEYYRDPEGSTQQH